TVGGPVHRNKTFLFGAFQQDTFRFSPSGVGTASSGLRFTVPTEPAVATLRSLFPSNPRLDMYLDLLGPLRGSANPIPVKLGNDPITGADRGVVEFATAPAGVWENNAGPQWMVRLDHNRSEEHRLSLRHIYDSRLDSPRHIAFPGFSDEQTARNENVVFTDQYTFSPTWSNEFRFSYGRQDAVNNRIAAKSSPLAWTLPRFVIGNIDSPGVDGQDLQSRHVNNL